MSRTTGAWLLFGGSSLVAVATGCWIASQHGVAQRVWMMNLAVWVIGAIAAVALARIKTQRWWPLLALIGLASTFPSVGMSGVHRWIAVGVRFNAAELLLPPTLGALGTQFLLSFPILILLALQPDTSQAVAFAGAMIATAVMSRRYWAVLPLAAIAALSFLRPDTLAPVSEVEGILGLASPAVAMVAILALAGTTLSPLLVRGYSLTVYLALCALAPFYGTFPVLLVGMGVSPILGAWLGFGALMGSIRE